MIQSNLYIDLRGRHFNLSDLDDEERSVLEDFRALAATDVEWHDYENEHTRRVGEFYTARGLTRRQIVDSDLWKITQDIGGRLGIERGIFRTPDYRDELEAIIRERFTTRREFCRATGIREDMLSHVLAGRKDLSIESLSTALAKIGCTLRIVPMELERTDAE